MNLLAPVVYHYRLLLIPRYRIGITCYTFGPHAFSNCDLTIMGEGSQGRLLNKKKNGLVSVRTCSLSTKLCSCIGDAFTDYIR